MTLTGVLVLTSGSSGSADFVSGPTLKLSLDFPDMKRNVNVLLEGSLKGLSIPSVLWKSLEDPMPW